VAADQDYSQKQKYKMEEICYFASYIACKQTLGEIPSAVKRQNWDSAPLHKLIKNFPLFARPLA
jgi:hypothetical protein